MVVIKTREKPKNGGVSGYQTLTSNAEKAKPLHLFQQEKFAEWKGKNKLPLSRGKENTKLGKNIRETSRFVKCIQISWPILYSCQSRENSIEQELQGV